MTNTLLDNEITRAVANIDGILTTRTPEQIASLEDAATLDMGDWLTMGDAASRAMLAGIISQDGAQALHGIHTRFHQDASLAERLVFIQCMGEILPALMKRGF